MNLMHPDLLRKFKYAKTKEEFILPYISTFEELLETETFFTLVSILIYNKDFKVNTGVKDLDKYLEDKCIRDDIIHAYHKSKYKIDKDMMLKFIDIIISIYKFF